MPLSTPSLMFEEALNPIKGWPHEAALDMAGKMHSDVDFDVPGGRCVHVDSIDTVEVGATTQSKQVPVFKMGVSGTQMGLFLFQASNAADVSNPGRTAKSNFVHEAIAPAGINGALVAKGGYELQTTEFDSDKTYSPNDLLTAGTSNTDKDTGGVLTNEDGGGNSLTVPWAGGGTTRAICGVVSRGVFENEHKASALHFWPVWLPGTT